MVGLGRRGWEEKRREEKGGRSLVNVKGDAWGWIRCCKAGLLEEDVPYRLYVRNLCFLSECIVRCWESYDCQ